jgi:hypothetical protein
VLYTATEARSIAARLEHVITSEDWRSGELVELVVFLRHGADVLAEEQLGRDLHEEFSGWR